MPILNVRMPEPLKIRIKNEARKRGITLSELCRNLFELELDDSMNIIDVLRLRKKKFGCRKNLSKSFREQFKDKKGKRCEKCGITEEKWVEFAKNSQVVYSKGHCLHIAHIIPQCFFSDKSLANIEENLILLCPKCHYEQHHNLIQYVNNKTYK